MAHFIADIFSNDYLGDEDSLKAGSGLCVRTLNMMSTHLIMKPKLTVKADLIYAKQYAVNSPSLYQNRT